MPFRFVFAALLLLARPLAAGGWPEIPAAVWQMKATDPGNELGAVFLDDEVRLSDHDSEYRLRIRIMSNAGKDAARLGLFDSSLFKVEGRTVYPDGKVVEFDSAKDFAEQTVKTSAGGESTKVIIPPGLTDDCIVDLHWIIKGSQIGGFDSQGNYVGNYWFRVVIPRAFPVRKKVIELTRWSPMSSVVMGFGSHPPQVEKKDAYRVYTFTDVPAFEDIPYSIPITRERAELFLYWQPDVLRRMASDPGKYWNDLSKNWISKDFDTDLKTGRAYKAFLAKVTEGLPEDPIQKAQTIIQRIQGAILNIDHMTAEQARARTKAQANATFQSQDLDRAIEDGWTNAVGIDYLAFKLLLDAGLHPRLVYTVNREERVFHADLPCIFQFSDYLILVPGKDGRSVAWFDPGNRLLPPGIIPPQYQGTPAFAVDGGTWEAHPDFHVPIQPAAVNSRTYAYDLNLDDEGLQVSGRANFTGIPLWVERDTYYRLEQAEQAKKLMETLQERLPSYRLTKEEVVGAQDLTKTLSWSFQALKPLDEGRKVLVDPFPGLRSPLWIPASWPAQRAVTLVLPYASIETAVCTIHVPKGYQPLLDPEYSNGNAFGSVSWSALDSGEGTDRTVVVTLKIVVNRVFGSAYQYQDFKNYMGWIDHALGIAVSLQKARS
ncbi:MAG TPA: hypothetical protein VFT46_12615 [Holophagaceae bacterium]|nr:hypothetical protein [Holophagaceae bacterium]